MKKRLGVLLSILLLAAFPLQAYSSVCYVQLNFGNHEQEKDIFRFSRSVRVKACPLIRGNLKKKAWVHDSVAKADLKKAAEAFNQFKIEDAQRILSQLIDRLQKNKKKTKELLDAYLLQAKIFYEQGKIESTKQSLNQLLNLDPDNHLVSQQSVSPDFYLVYKQILQQTGLHFQQAENMIFDFDISEAKFNRILVFQSLANQNAVKAILYSNHKKEKISEVNLSQKLTAVDKELLLSLFQNEEKTVHEEVVVKTQKTKKKKSMTALIVAGAVLLVGGVATGVALGLGGGGSSSTNTNTGIVTTSVSGPAP